MSLTLERTGNHALLRLEGTANVACAEELKRRLLEGLAYGGDLRLDLERAEEVDITVLQLLWADGCEAARAGVEMVSGVSEAAAASAREAGFERFPGTRVQE